MAAIRLTIAFLLMVSGPSVGSAWADGDLVTVCHVSPAGAKEIVVSASATAALLRQHPADALGACLLPPRVRAGLATTCEPRWPPCPTILPRNKIRYSATASYRCHPRSFKETSRPRSSSGMQADPTANESA